MESKSKKRQRTATRVSDAAVRAATGRGRDQWFAMLDRWGAAKQSHRDIAAWLAKEHRVPGWWRQTLAVDYEQARGLRQPGADRNGKFTVNASRTVEVPVKQLFDAVVNPSVRRRWLAGIELRERTRQPSRGARFDWGDGSTRVVFFFTEKGKTKSQVALAHERLPNATVAKEMKAFWRTRMDALAERFASKARP